MLYIYPLFIGTWEIIAIVALVLLLFGGKKIPELMKGLGQGVKSFKKGMNEVEGEITDIKKDIETTGEVKKDN
ncbi:MAG: twin-arginine translocase TatA/TatE family subunit [Bacteroidales bacterium]|nr:twin-arginine translocase TatA/TatE family subunit [Bacteroidales bacterium]